MMFSLVPAFSGMLALALLPTDSMKWTRWGMYMMQVIGVLPGLSNAPQHKMLVESSALNQIDRRRNDFQ
jgi:hypothetical protein